MANEIEIDSGFFERLGTSPAVTALVVGVAERVAANARESAPVDSGAYRDSIGVSVKRQKRSVALVTATDKKSMLIEAKTGNLVRALNKEKRGRG